MMSIMGEFTAVRVIDNRRTALFMSRDAAAPIEFKSSRHCHTAERDGRAAISRAF